MIDRFLQPYLQFLDQFTPVQPAVLLLKQMARNGTIHDMVFNEMENCEAKFFTVCHKNLWSGNIFLKPNDLTSHSVALVDWTHAEIGRISHYLVNYR